MSNVSKGQIQLPGEFHPGEPIRAGDMDKLRKAIAFALKDMIGGGRGVTVTQSAGKYLISTRKQRTASIKFPLFPFQVIRSTNEAGDQNIIKIRSGSVNGVIPEEIDHEDIEDSTLYDLSNGWNNIFLKVTVGVDLGLSVAEIEISDSFPPNTDTVGYDRIAAVNVVDGAVVTINQYVRANVSYVYGGDSIHLFFK